MTTLILEARHLRAALLFSGKKDVRYYLNGVCIEVTKEGIYTVATNGHTLFAALRTWASDEAPDAALFGKTYILELTAKDVGRAKAAMLTLRDDLTAELNMLDKRIVVKIMDAKFPDWRRIVHSAKHGCEQVAAFFNPDYLAVVKCAGEILGSRNGDFQLQQNGDSAALATFKIEPDALAIIMPMRADVVGAVNVPSWGNPAPASKEVSFDEFCDSTLGMRETIAAANAASLAQGVGA